MANSLYLINPRSAVATYFGAEALFADLASGSWQREYDGGDKPDLQSGHIWEPHVAAGGPSLGPPQPAAGSGLVTIGSGTPGS